jgi:hypothetical protein
MPERIGLWWARRQFSRGTDVPYEVGTYREAWASYPALIRQYHPDLNAGIVLTQIPPAADVLLLWQCEAGHTFVATPDEQRHRPGRERRRSAWCPECTLLAKPPIVRTTGVGAPGVRAPVVERAGVERAVVERGVGVDRVVGGGPAAGATPSASASVSARGRTRQRPRAPRRLCTKTPDLLPGEPFASECAPRPASAAEAKLRLDLFALLDVTPGCNAVRVSRPFFDHLEVWPDILLPELRVAIEYDSTGRHGLEHVGTREDADRRKDRALRGAGWEVVRLRTGKLAPIGPYDLQLASVTKRSLVRVVDVLREIRGPLMVDAYLR